MGALLKVQEDSGASSRCFGAVFIWLADVFSGGLQGFGVVCTL